MRCRTLAIMTDDPDPDDVQIEALRQEITHDLYVLAAMTRETEAKARRLNALEESRGLIATVFPFPKRPDPSEDPEPGDFRPRPSGGSGE